MPDCVYCGGQAETRDHVPPKNLFAKPRPQLFRVASCRACNNGASDDDEYFRLTLSMAEGSGDHPDAKGVLPAVLRSLQNPQKLGMAKGLSRASRRFTIRSPAGLILGKRFGFHVDLTRLDRVVLRVMKGLFYKEFGYRLPDTCEAHVFSQDGLTDLPTDVFDNLREQFIRPTIANAPRTFGNRTLEYWVASDPASAGTSSWIFRFYGHYASLGFTFPSPRGGLTRS